MPLLLFVCTSMVCMADDVGEKVEEDWTCLLQHRSTKRKFPFGPVRVDKTGMQAVQTSYKEQHIHLQLYLLAYPLTALSRQG